MAFLSDGLAPLGATGVDRPRLLDERYVLERPIGEGGMGEVWLARHRTLLHPFAVKLLRPTSRGEVPRFEREAKISALISSSTEHVVRLVDYGVQSEGGTVWPYMVFDYLQGETLAARLKREGKLGLPLVVQLVTQVAHALSAIHGAGVIHRDLKPGNIFLCEVPEPGRLHCKLIDFGIAKFDDAAGVDAEALTRTGMLLGTPGYISPEQIRGGTVDARADVWALGVLVYRCLVGELPFGGGSFEEVSARVLWSDFGKSEPVDLPEWSAIQGWLGRALAKNPDDRFPSAEVALASLQNGLGIPVSSVRASACAQAEFGGAASTAKMPGPSSGKKQLGRGTVVFVGLLSVVSLLGAVRLWMGRREALLEPKVEQATTPLKAAHSPVVNVATAVRQDGERRDTVQVASKAELSSAERLPPNPASVPAPSPSSRKASSPQPVRTSSPKKADKSASVTSVPSWKRVEEF